MAFDPTKPVQTRNGRKARIVCTDFKGSRPILALVEDLCNTNLELTQVYNTDGTIGLALCEDLDLVNVPEKFEFLQYAIICRNPLLADRLICYGSMFTDIVTANEVAGKLGGIVHTIKIVGEFPNT